MKQRLVYTDPFWAVDGQGNFDARASDFEKKILREDVEIVLGEWGGKHFNVAPETLGRLIEDSDAVVVYRAQFAQSLVDRLPERCRVVGRQGDGIDNIDVEALRRRGIYSFNIPDYCIGEAADHTLALILAYERGLLPQGTLLAAGEWSPLAGRPPRRLSELTIGLIGLGRVGKAVSVRCRPIFGRIIAYDPMVHRDVHRSLGIEYISDVDELLAAADYISLHADLNTTSRAMFSDEAIQKMRQGAILVNLARGGLVRTESVLSALESGFLGGYLTDVFSPEPPQDEHLARLVATGRFLGTCHRGFLSLQAVESLRRRAVEQVRRVLFEGLPPSYGRLS